MASHIQIGDGDLINGMSVANCASFSDFNIGFSNIRSLRSNFSLLLANVSNFIIEPDIIFLSEIWINNDEANCYKMPGYKFYSCCNDSNRAGGTAVHVKDNITITNHFNYQLITADCLEINFKVGKVHFIALCIYRYHLYSINNYLDEIVPILHKHSRSKNFLLIGHINIDLLQNSNIIDIYKMTQSSLGLYSLINIPTRIVNDSSSCIDHAFYRFRAKNVSIVGELADFHVSDHLPIRLKLTIKSVSRNPEIRLQHITSTNYELLNNLLQSQKWDDILLSNCV